MIAKSSPGVGLDVSIRVGRYPILRDGWSEWKRYNSPLACDDCDAMNDECTRYDNENCQER